MFQAFIFLKLTLMRALRCLNALLDLAYSCQIILQWFWIAWRFQDCCAQGYLAKLLDIFTSWEFHIELILNSFSLVIFKLFIKSFFLINCTPSNLIKIWCWFRSWISFNWISSRYSFKLTPGSGSTPTIGPNPTPEKVYFQV